MYGPCSATEKRLTRAARSRHMHAHSIDTRTPDSAPANAGMPATSLTEARHVNRASQFSILVFAAVTWSLGAQAELPAEKLSVVTLPPANPHRLYLTDAALNHVIDSRVHIVDGANMKYLGMISTGLSGITTLSHDSSEMLVATTYYTKRNRGDRFDQLEAYSTKDLSLKAEISIPPKHAMALPYKGTIAPSVDGRYVMIQNATPLSSVTVVDRKAGKVTSEVPTPGCWIVLPAQSNPSRFATLCGDGTLVTVTLDKDGKPASQQRSTKLFDAEKDPLFVQGERVGDLYTFVSYEGTIHEINVGGETAKTEATWSLLDDADRKAAWKPGGYQPLALHAATKQLYVAMHDAGRDGSHKRPAKEIWAFDLANKKRVARAPGSGAIAIALSKEVEPKLFAYDGINMAYVRYDTTPALKPVATSKALGEFVGLLETH